MDKILTHSPFVFPEGTFLQRRPKLKASIFRILAEGMVRDNEEQYCVELNFIFTLSFGTHELTWKEGIDGKLNFLPTRLVNLPDHLQFSSFREAVLLYVNEHIKNINDFSKYETYDSFLEDNGLLYIPYEVLEICYKICGMHVDVNR